MSMETTAQSHTPNGAANDSSQYLTNGKTSVPLARPMPDRKPTPKPALTPDQDKKYNELLATVTAWTAIPSTTQKNAQSDPLTELERLWLTRECLLRYLRATSWASADAAAKRLQATMTWRREYGLTKFTPDYISPENETGKQVLFGYDNEGRPCHYMNPGKQNTELSDRQLHHLVYMLESAIDLMGPGQEMVALLINYKSATSAKSPPMSQSRETLNILQSHYPERLGRALMSDSMLPYFVRLYRSFTNIASFFSALVHHHVLQANLTIYRPGHQNQDEIQ